MGTTNLGALVLDDGLLASQTPLKGVKLYTATYNPASIAAATSVEQTFTVTGVTTADVVVVIKPTATVGVGIVNARVSAADTVAVTWMNATAGAVDPASETYTVLAFRF